MKHLLVWFAGIPLLIVMGLLGREEVEQTVAMGDVRRRAVEPVVQYSIGIPNPHFRGLQ
jgi:hypothetical protein